MKQIGVKLVGEAERFTLEQRILNVALLLGILMTGFGTAMDVYYGSNLWNVNLWIDLGFFGVWIGSYYLARAGRHFQLIAVVTICVIVFAFFPYQWTVSNGIAGVLPHYAVFFMAVVSMVLVGRFRLIMVSSLLAVEMLLILRDIQTGAHPNVQWDWLLHLGVIMAGMAVMMIFYSNIYLKEKARSEAYARTIEKHYRQQLYYMQNLEELNYKLKAERHDYNHHLGVIYGLLENREVDQARDYAGKLVSAAKEYHNLVNIPYAMLRAMLNYKLSAAKEAGISLKLDVNLPGELRLNEFDLAVILGNLLDNAMESCAALEEERRYIFLSIRSDWITWSSGLKIRWTKVKDRRGPQTGPPKRTPPITGSA